MAQTLLERGWKDVRPLAGGLDAWRQAGYPVEPKTELAHAAENLREAEGDPDLPG